MLPMTLVITQNIGVKVQKYPQIQDLYVLFFLRLNTYFHSTWIMGKQKNPLSSYLIFFWSWGQQNIFTIKKLMKNQESHWSTALNFVDWRGKNVFLWCKKMKKTQVLPNNLSMTNRPVKKTKSPQPQGLIFFSFKDKWVISL